MTTISNYSHNNVSYIISPVINRYNRQAYRVTVLLESSGLGDDISVTFEDEEECHKWAIHQITYC